ncbi:transcription elongation factor spt5-like [Syzygium oleosum]|uniref:transcription elongation factor spt5-like n=1 Tax=Syzygium oleosum TaxID=219896 RepID=UPI0024B94590|nr:transcription elongation factor spt5-like [Syzygium oleosum]
MEMKMESLSYVDEELDFGFFHVESEAEDAISAQWELVNASDAGSDRSDSDAPDSPVSDGPVYDLGLANGIARVDDLDERDPVGRNGDPRISRPIRLPETLEFRADDYVVKADVEGDWRRDGRDDDDDDDDDEDGDGGEEEMDEDDDGLDDELVPRHLSGKFGRQRIRKLGKRACSKMNYSKRSPHLFVKPGCLHGKHGLGLKHSL